MSDLLIDPPSFNLIPEVFDVAARSDPARSIRAIFDFLSIITFSFSSFCVCYKSVIIFAHAKFMNLDKNLEDSVTSGRCGIHIGCGYGSCGITGGHELKCLVFGSGG